MLLSPEVVLRSDNSISLLEEKINIPEARICVVSTNFEIEINDLLENIRDIIKFILSKKRSKIKSRNAGGRA